MSIRSQYVVKKSFIHEQKKFYMQRKNKNKLRKMYFSFCLGNILAYLNNSTLKKKKEKGKTIVQEDKIFKRRNQRKASF